MAIKCGKIPGENVPVINAFMFYCFVLLLFYINILGLVHYLLFLDALFI